MEILEVLEEAKVLVRGLTDRSVKGLQFLSDCREETTSWINSTPACELHLYIPSSKKQTLIEINMLEQKAQNNLSYNLPLLPSLMWCCASKNSSQKLSCSLRGNRKWDVLGSQSTWQPLWWGIPNSPGAAGTLRGSGTPWYWVKWKTEAPAKAGIQELVPGDAEITHKGLLARHS